MNREAWTAHYQGSNDRFRAGVVAVVLIPFVAVLALAVGALYG